MAILRSSSTRPAVTSMRRSQPMKQMLMLTLTRPSRALTTPYVSSLRFTTQQIVLAKKVHSPAITSLSINTSKHIPGHGMYSDVYAACNMNLSWRLLQEEHLKHFQRMAQQKHDDNKAKLCRHLNELNERLNQKGDWPRFRIMPQPNASVCIPGSASVGCP